MSRRQKSRKSAAAKRAVAQVHPVMLRADIVAEQRARFAHEAVAVANPDGEVMQRGEIKQHIACRRVPHFETLYRSSVIDRHVFICLEWYADRLALATGGMFRCPLDASGGGGSSATHIPTTAALAAARSDVEWARGFVPVDARPVFDAVMGDGETFASIGPRVFPHLCADRAQRRASSMFKLAANHLLAGVGHRIGRQAGAVKAG